MKTTFKSLAVTTVCVGLLSSTCFAQNTAAQPVRNDVASHAQADQVGKMDSKMSGSTIRVSQLMGMNIYNDAGESVGEINDVVVDAQSGKIRYAAVTYGGFLGIGNKMFAVPFEAFQCKTDPDDADDHKLILNVTQQQMEGATGFDEDHWPNFSDKNFTNQLDKRYGVNRMHDSLNGGNSQ